MATFYPIIIYCIILFPCIPMQTHSRRIIHKPFFPADSSELSPSSSSSSSSSSQSPNRSSILFYNSTLNQKPFFPYFPSPPPLSSTFSPVPSVNFSSFITLPPTPKSKHYASGRRLSAIIAVIVLLSFFLITAAAMIFYSRRLRRQQSLIDRFDSLIDEFDNFLIGSGFVDVIRPNPTRNHACNASGNNGGGDLPSQELGSSEVPHPLPQLHHSHSTADIELGCGREEEEEVYSPSRTLSCQQNSICCGSSSRVMVKNSPAKINDLSLSNISPLASPIHSISISLPSSPMTSSPRSLVPKCPGSVATIVAPLSPPPLTLSLPPPLPSLAPLPCKRKYSPPMPSPSSLERKIRRLYNPKVESLLNSEIVEASEETSQLKMKSSSQRVEVRASSDYQEHELGWKESSSSMFVQKAKEEIARIQVQEIDYSLSLVSISMGTLPMKKPIHSEYS